MSMELYCDGCGEKLKLVDTVGTGKYNTDTGREYIVKTYRCPNKRHWWDKHLVVGRSTEPFDMV